LPVSKWSSELPTSTDTAAYRPVVVLICLSLHSSLIRKVEV
jgi:hypothetical protein